jgi:hypothetical protein
MQIVSSRTRFHITTTSYFVYLNVQVGSGQLQLVVGS